jgi:hypothetical protein
MAEPIRISPEEAKQKVTSGSALLVCAYDNEQKFRQVHLKGAISLTEFKSKHPSLAREAAPQTDEAKCQ